MRKPIRFKSRKTILSAIDDKQHSLAMARKLGAQHTQEADRLMKELALFNPDDRAWSELHREKFHSMRRAMEEHRKNAGIKERSIPRLENELVRLKHALAEFDTQPIAFLEDTSVRL